MPPPQHDLLTDDYVAELLAKEANDCSLKYSAMGLDAYKSSKRPANQPKPNTRFLNNIIRDTNSHNRALLAKENAESQARLRDLEDAEEKKRRDEERKLRRSRPGPSDTRKRMLGDIAAILGGSPKRRRDDKSGRHASNAEERAAEGNSSGRRHKTTETRDEIENKNSRKELFLDSHHHHHRHSHRRDSRRDLSRSRSPEERTRKHRERSPRRKGDLFDEDRPRSDRRKRLESAYSSSKNESSDSDPLDDIIGPAPPPSAHNKAPIRPRGRGAHSSTSGIDSRFAADYNPQADVTPNLDEDDGGGGVSGSGGDWDSAVEAFRDRQKWKQQGAERLRSAGFTEEQIRKWEKGDRKDESDVRWNTHGGVREWDRGKVLDEDGSVAVKAEWGRLKDS
ncbi:hypothetical protein F4809DRAFT_90549 [Biscogniauxia mediterranea]|nr:hypothetical protein F4809DRAFT_90549 [Biscogniauxia mediterranea]